MKPSFFVLGAAMLLMSASLGWAQNSASTTGSVIGTVQYALHMHTLADMELSHNMQRGQTYVVAPSDPNAAMFYTEGDAGDGIAYTIPATFTLSLGTIDPINIPQLPGVNPVGTQASTITANTPQAMVGLRVNGSDKVAYANGSTTPLGPATGLNIGTNVPGVGRKFLYVGYTFPIDPSQQRGVYLGYMVVQVDYQN